MRWSEGCGGEEEFPERDKGARGVDHPGAEQQFVLKGLEISLVA